MRYRRPVSLPGAITVRTWMEERSEGRELWLRGKTEDGDESVFGGYSGWWCEVYPVQCFEWTPVLFPTVSYHWSLWMTMARGFANV
jgi:hypothetical protein